VRGGTKDQQKDDDNDRPTIACKASIQICCSLREKPSPFAKSRLRAASKACMDFFHTAVVEEEQSHEQMLRCCASGTSKVEPTTLGQFAPSDCSFVGSHAKVSSEPAHERFPRASCVNAGHGASISFKGGSRRTVEAHRWWLDGGAWKQS